ncbi:MAG: ribonuclease H [Candidatus Parcubacteria bacterium]|nr:MAG: ribonuclease H [Candidatus Parcubacteria bacterium]
MKNFSSDKKIVIYTDGGSRGNPGPSALGVYFKDFEKKYSFYLGEGTNNQAEYKAIIFALKKAKQLIGKEKAKKTLVEIRADSQLVVNQLNGVFKLKEKELWPLFIEIWNLKQDFLGVEFKFVPRQENKVADFLVNQALNIEAQKLF